MEEPKPNRKIVDTLDGFSPVSSTPVFWKSRKRSASVMKKKTVQPTENKSDKTPPREKMEEIIEPATESAIAIDTDTKQDEYSNTPVVLSEKRKALFEPLEPITTVNGRRPSNESLLPPPDFDAASYPKGWLIGKKRKLVNVDVVESMRRIAVQEMNRKDREIDGLNEQLDEDSRVLEHLQIQLLEERSKRSEVERENAMLQNQITMLMDMLQENEPLDDDHGGQEP